MYVTYVTSSCILAIILSITVVLFHFCFSAVLFINQVSTHFTCISTCLSTVSLPTYSARWHLSPALMLNLIRIGACYNVLGSFFPYNFGRLQPMPMNGYYLINAQLFCYAEVSNKGKRCEIVGVGIRISHQGTENSIHMWNYTFFSQTNLTWWKPRQCCWYIGMIKTL